MNYPRMLITGFVDLEELRIDLWNLWWHRKEGIWYGLDLPTEPHRRLQYEWWTAGRNDELMDSAVQQEKRHIIEPQPPTSGVDVAALLSDDSYP